MSKAGRITFDCETYRTRNRAVLAGLQLAAAAKRPPKKVKAEAMAAWDSPAGVASRFRQMVSDTAKDPLLAEPLCVVWMTDGGEPDFVEAMTGSQGNPQAAIDRMLEELSERWEELTGPETVWCAFNGEGYDVPLLQNNFIRSDVKPPRYFPRVYGGRVVRGRLFDPMKQLPGKRLFVGLEDGCQALGIGAMEEVLWEGEPMEGSRVGAAYEAGEYGLIVEYCVPDVEWCDRLVERMTFGGTWGAYVEDEALGLAVSEILGNEGMTAVQRKAAAFDLLLASGKVPRAVMGAGV